MLLGSRSKLAIHAHPLGELFGVSGAGGGGGGGGEFGRREVWLKMGGTPKKRSEFSLQVSFQDHP